MITESQKEKCRAIIHTASVSCAAIGAMPVPGSDAMPIIAAQVSMIVALGRVLDVSIDAAYATSLAKTAIAKQAGKYVACQFTKFVPGFGSVVNATVAFSLTETLGWDVVKQFSAA